MLHVEQFGAGLGGVSVYQVVLWGGVCRHCVVVSRGNLMAVVLRNIHFFL